MPSYIEQIELCGIGTLLNMHVQQKSIHHCHYYSYISQVGKIDPFTENNPDLI